MKAQFQGKIKNIRRNDDDMNSPNSDMVTIDLEMVGKVKETQVTAKEAALTCQLKVKPLIAEQLKFGSLITIFVSDEEPEIER